MQCSLPTAIFRILMAAKRPATRSTILVATLGKAQSLGVSVLVPPFVSEGRRSAIVQFPGGYIAEIHSTAH